MAALEVQNVKRAINRYGTLPKGARIGAYLESLRASGGGAAGAAGAGGAVGAGGAARLEEARSLSPRTGRAQPHMIRSNSSGGVTAAPASPRAPPALRSFAGSPAKPRPRLPDLEFPPPPPDLPPPDEPLHPAPPPPPPPTDAKQAMKEMLELKLVAEIKERADKKHRLEESPPAAEASAPPAPCDPAARLVSELSESLRLADPTPRRPSHAAPPLTAPPPPPPADDTRETVSPIDLKASLRKTSFSNNAERRLESDVRGTDFKSQLKKVETKKKPAVAAKEEEGGRSIIDFKARLRKVESGGAATNGSSRRSPEERRDSEAAAAAEPEPEEDKRRSTGSITSLKKLWESKESEERVSPKPAEGGSPEERARPAPPHARLAPRKGGIYATPLPADEDSDGDLLAALRASLDCCTNEVRAAWRPSRFRRVWI